MSNLNCNFAPDILNRKQMEVKRTNGRVEIDPSELAAELSTWRLRQGLTQAALAERWHVSRYTIIRAEQCKEMGWRTAYVLYSHLCQELRKEGGVQ